MSNNYLRYFKNATIDVVEIDPGMTRMARQYFNLKDNPRMHIFHEDGRSFRAFYATCKTIFPQIYVFAVYYRNNPNVIQNIMLVCLKSEGSVQMESTNEEFSRYFQDNLIKEDIENDMPIFTDDFAPVDQYNLNML